MPVPLAAIGAAAATAGKALAGSAGAAAAGKILTSAAATAGKALAGSAGAATAGKLITSAAPALVRGATSLATSAITRYGAEKAIMNFLSNLGKNGLSPQKEQAFLSEAVRLFLSRGLPQQLLVPSDSNWMLRDIFEKSGGGIWMPKAGGGGGGLPPINNTPTASAFPDPSNVPLPDFSVNSDWSNSEPSLDDIYNNPFDVWSHMDVGPENPPDTKSAADEVFEEQRRARDFLREQKRVDAELERELDQANQDYADEKLRKYYKKPASQTFKEQGLRFAGRAAQGIGESLDLYNSILANSLVQSAAGLMSEEQARMYGNPFASGTALYAGARQAGGKIASAVGKQFGNWLRDWSDSLAAEYNMQRMMRMQLEGGGRAVGQMYDAIGRAGRREHLSNRD